MDIRQRTTYLNLLFQILAELNQVSIHTFFYPYGSSGYCLLEIRSPSAKFPYEIYEKITEVLQPVSDGFTWQRDNKGRVIVSYPKVMLDLHLITGKAEIIGSTMNRYRIPFRRNLTRRIIRDEIYKLGFNEGFFCLLDPRIDSQQLDEFQKEICKLGFSVQVGFGCAHCEQHRLSPIPHSFQVVRFVYYT
jgi:hypothetical protein